MSRGNDSCAGDRKETRSSFRRQPDAQQIKGTTGSTPTRPPNGLVSKVYRRKRDRRTRSREMREESEDPLHPDEDAKTHCRLCQTVWAREGGGGCYSAPSGAILIWGCEERREGGGGGGCRTLWLSYLVGAGGFVEGWRCKKSVAPHWCGLNTPSGRGLGMIRRRPSTRV